MIENYISSFRWKSGMWFIDYQQLKFCHALKEFREYFNDLVVLYDLGKHSLYHWHCRCQLAVQEICNSMVRLCHSNVPDSNLMPLISLFPYKDLTDHCDKITLAM